MELWANLPYTIRVVALGSAALGIVSGALGTYAVLRRQSLLGDAISHAALPGIVLAFYFFRSKDPLTLVVGAGIAGWLATLLILAIVHATRIKYDTALALILSVFFGAGLMLLTFVQRQPGASKAGLKDFLFGQAAAMLERDIVTIAVLGGAALGLMVLCWKEFKLLSFDPEFGSSLGFPMRLIDVLLTSLLIVAIVVGLQTVGVVLMSAMLVAPASAARQWTDRLAWVVLLSAVFGALAGVSGALLSGHPSLRLPTGPMIVVCASTLVGLSLLFAPKRGLLWSALGRWMRKRRLRIEAVLADLHALAGQHESRAHGHDTAVLQAMSLGHGDVRRSLHALEDRGFVRRSGADQWILTDEGHREAERQRLDRHGEEPA